jgi:hypothetical protein
MANLSIIIVTYNSAKDIDRCLRSVERTKNGLELEIFVVDNASTDDTVRILRNRYPHVALIANDFNAGFPAGNNQAIVRARGRYLLLLNPDTEVLPDALEAIVGFMDRNPQCGVSGPRLQDARGELAGEVWAPSFWRYLAAMLSLDRIYEGHRSQDRVQVVSGACLAFRAELVEKVGLLDEDLFWCEDADFCVRARQAGYEVRVVHDSHVMHLGGQSGKTNPGLMLEKQYTSGIGFLRKHASSLQVRLTAGLLSVEGVARWIKWRLRFLLHNSAEAEIRARTLRKVLAGMIRVVVCG